MKLYNVVKDNDYNIALQFLAWCALPVFLVLFSAGFVHVMAPQAIGMKTFFISTLFLVFHSYTF